MRQTRRTWLRAAAAAIAGVGLAGCQGSDDDEDATPTEGDGENGQGSEGDGEQQSESESENGESEDEESEGPPTAVDAAPEDVAIAAEWNAIRTRLRDPVILGHADRFDGGEAVAAGIFERFETAAGDPNAHEALEAASEEAYAGFEDGLGGLREALAADDLEVAHDEMKAADGHLREAQGATVGPELVKPLTLLVLGAHVEDAALLARIGAFGEAAHEFEKMGSKFDENMREMVAGADEDAAAAFAGALDDAAAAASEEDGEAVAASATEAFDAAIRGVHGLLPEEVAGAAHLAALQARGWDAAALARLGGPGSSFAHAAALTQYRMRAHDAVRLYERGNAEAAVAAVEDALAQFETARVHEALEDADGDAYETFEHDGLDALATAIAEDDAEAVEAAAGAVEEGVTAGIVALGSGAEPALLEAGYANARIEDALDRYRAGEQDAAAETARAVFERFEANAAGFHETLEETDESLYERFEHDHLEALIEAFEGGDDDAVDDHVAGIRETLLAFETAAGSTAAVSAVESGYVAGRAFDAGVLAAAGEGDRAADVLQETLGYFEGGAGGFHEALEAADQEAYESFEDALAAAADAAADGPATGEIRAFGERATDAAYAVVSSAGGSFGAAATSIMETVFAHFEEARVHDMLEDADPEAYEAFEAALDGYLEALDAGTGVDAAAERFAAAALGAQFAVAGAPDAGPSVESPDDDSGTDLTGGPNVVEGVPDDADHVVDMEAVAFAPTELTVQQGDTVAWRHAAGEPHSVTAYEDGIPGDATYWASGGFESEDAAREGWENGEGAIQAGQSYVRTFETAGEHEYVCIPHEAAGMVGTVVVE